MLFFRALFAFLALPAVVGGLLPWLLLGNDGWRTRGTALGWPVVLFGACVLLWCVRDFYAIGKGTLAPWDPPKKLVVAGFYRFVRNPIYTGMLGMLVASVLAVSQWWVLIPALVFFCLGTWIRVRAEERLLREAFGAQYDDYARRVPALIPFLI